MLIFFPTPYPDELLYSICARYHVRSGNISYKRTLDDIFENRSLSASISLPSGISALVKNLSSYSTVTEKQLILRHTLYFFYTAFLSKEKSDQIYKSMCSEDGKDIYVRAGINASGVPQNEFLRFCPQCSKEDREKYGEHYWHRSHQLPGIHCCLRHFSPLYNSSVRVTGENKHRFEIPTSENCIISKQSHVFNGVKKQTVLEYKEALRKLAPNIKKILNKPFEKKEYQWFDQKYRSELVDLNMAYYTGRVQQKVWRDYFQSVFSKDILVLFFSSLNGHSDWLSMIVQKNRKSFHPIRHLLAMSALGLSVEQLFDEAINKPFGNPKWLCLNAVCEYYHKPIIEEVELSLCEKTKVPIGTFTCPNCQFSYTRRGPDTSEEDRFRKTRVKQYGYLWEQKLREWSKLDLGIRELSRRVGADPNTVNRFLERAEEEGIPRNHIICKNHDRKAWIDLQKHYPKKSIKELREIEKALYMRLYRKDRDWLKNNSPKPIKRTSVERVDWGKRDVEILAKVKAVVHELLNPEIKPKRITIGRVGQMIGEKALLEKKLAQLPQVKKYLYENIETVEQFQERRIKYVIEQMRINGEEIVEWKVIRKSGLKNYNKKTCEIVEQILNVRLRR